MADLLHGLLQVLTTPFFAVMILAGIVCVGFAGLDEYHQSFVDSRTPSVKDVGIDSIGAMIGVLLVQAFCWSALNSPVKKKKKKRK